MFHVRPLVGLGSLYKCTVKFSKKIKNPRQNLERTPITLAKAEQFEHVVIQ